MRAAAVTRSWLAAKERSESGNEGEAVLPIACDRYDGNWRGMQGGDEDAHRGADNCATHGVGDEMHPAEYPRRTDEGC